MPPTGTAVPYGFLLDEDAAMWQKLQGLQFFDRRDQAQKSNVGVWYRFPDAEEAPKRPFPHIVIDLVDIQFDPTRAQRAVRTILHHVPLGASPPALEQTVVQFDKPLPWSLIYQLGCFSRFPLHDRQFDSVIIGQVFPWAFGFLECNDGTVRRADLVNRANRDALDEHGKRLFQTVYTIAVSSELSLYAALSVYHVLSPPQISVTS